MRYKLTADEVRRDDLVRGPQHVDEKRQRDPALVGADTSYLYGFTSVVDDIDFAITHIIHAEDHVANMGAQLHAFRALDAPPPQVAHLPLLADAAGSANVPDHYRWPTCVRTASRRPALCALLPRLGTADVVEPVVSLDPLVEPIDFGRADCTAARFSERKLAHLSVRTLHGLAYGAVRDHLPPCRR